LRARAAVPEDRYNSYLPFVGQQRLREAIAQHVSMLAGVEYARDALDVAVDAERSRL
jgi:aspartate/methionine/tyrosine aminotransferase